MSEPTLLERVGVDYFRRLSSQARVVDEDGVHVLNDRELAALRATSRGAIGRALAAGAVSALASALAEVWANRLLGAVPALASDRARWWAVVLGATAVASVVEIGFLYWDGLRSVHRLTVVAGLELFGGGGDERKAVAHALARAALELPNPPRLRGLDATREAGRFELLVAPLVYKLKTSVSNFVIKALVRRALGRTALRGYLQTLLPFVAIPVTALWNGVVAWLVMREARLRVIGPSAARQLAAMALGEGARSERARAAAAQAVACAAVKSADLHPNLHALLDEVLAGAEGEGLGDAEAFVGALGALDEPEARGVLRLLCVAAVIDGRVAKAEQALIDRAFERRGLRLNRKALRALRGRLLRGRPIGGGLVGALVQGGH